MTDLRQFRANAAADGLCSEYSKIWDNCKSKLQIMDMCLGVKGLDYLCDAYAKGWGISSDAIHGMFPRFINGKYVFDNGDYTSTLYCSFTGEIKVSTTAICLIDCSVKLNIPKNALCEVYATGSTNIKISGGGSAAIIAYGNPEDVTIESLDGTKYKRVQKREKDSYGG
jgi:hypothetical protein